MEKPGQLGEPRRVAAVEQREGRGVGRRALDRPQRPAPPAAGGEEEQRPGPQARVDAHARCAAARRRGRRGRERRRGGGGAARRAPPAAPSPASRRGGATRRDPAPREAARRRRPKRRARSAAVPGPRNSLRYGHLGRDPLGHPQRGGEEPREVGAAPRGLLRRERERDVRLRVARRREQRRAVGGERSVAQPDPRARRLEDELRRDVRRPQRRQLAAEQPPSPLPPVLDLEPRGRRSGPAPEPPRWCGSRGRARSGPRSRRHSADRRRRGRGARAAGSLPVDSP